MTTEDEHTDVLNGGGAADEAEAVDVKKSARHDGGVADLERVTDYAEEKELSSTDIANAINIFGDKRNRETAEKLAKERELQKINVKKEDIDLISTELLITPQQAEKALREHRGDVVAALETLIN